MKLILTAAATLVCLCTSFSPSLAEAGVILDTNFSDAALYPSGDVALGTVNDGQGKWSFIGSAKAKELGGGKRGINMIGTGFNHYTFNDTFTEGAITVEFSFIPHHAQSIFDIQLASGTTNDDIGPQIRFGQNAANDVTYYTDEFITVPDVSFVVDEVNTFSFTAYLSGEKAGKFDLYLNGELVGEDLDWRYKLDSLTTVRMRIPKNHTEHHTDLVGLKITYDAIPEPSSVVLGITSLLLLGGVSRCFSQQRKG